MAPLQGLIGLDQPSSFMDEGVLEAHANVGGIDQTHSTVGDASGQKWPAAYGTGYNGEVWGWEASQGEMPEYDQPGYPLDRTPSTHVAPYATGIIQPNLEEPGSYADAATRLAEQQVILHSRGLGGERLTNARSPAGRETEIDTTVDRYDAPNSNVLATNIPGQLRSVAAGGGGVNAGGKSDTTQGYGKLNETEEFQRGHSIRIVQHDTLHFDHTLDNGGHTPFWGRKVIGEAQFNDPNGPYGEVGGDPSKGNQVPWEGRIGFPTSYVQPSEPTVVNPPSGDSDNWAWE